MAVKEAEENSIDIREYNEMTNRLVGYYLDAIEDPDTAIFVVKEYVHNMSIDEMKQQTLGVQND